MNERSRFVFCEGDDDLAVISGLVASLSIRNLTVEPYNGKDNLRNFLAALPTRPEFSQNKITAFAVVRDADQNAKSAFDSVKNSLMWCKYRCCPKHNGSFAGSNPRVGIFIVGPNEEKGTVEDLCLKSVSNLPEFTCLEAYFRCIEKHSGRKCLSSKAKIRAWMATHEDYDLRVGLAAKKGYWLWQHEVFNQLKQFLQELSNC